MDGLIQPGQRLWMQRGGGAVLVVENRLGEGSQGVVHRARREGALFAVKWFRPGPGEEQMRSPDGGEPKRVAPSQRLAVRPMLIDFGTAHGRIL